MTSVFRKGTVLALLSGMLTLGGCASLLASDPGALYELNAPPASVQAAPQTWQLVIDEPRSATRVDTDRIAVREGAFGVSYLPASKWVARAPVMVQDVLVSAFERTGAFTAVGRTPVGGGEGYILVTELGAFEAAIGGGAIDVNVRLAARIVRIANNEIVASTVVSQTAPATSDAAEDIVAAFDDALSAAVSALVSFVLDEGRRDWRGERRP